MSSEIINIEKALAIRIANGEERAFRELYDTYYSLVYNKAYSYLKSEHFATDVVQEVFIKIWNVRHKLPEINSLKNYIFIISRNQIITDLRKKVLHSTIDEDADLPEDDSVLPDNQLSLKEVTELVNKAIEALPQQQKIAFKLSRSEGMSYEQIAQQMDLSQLTVKTHISKAIHKIRDYLNSRSADLGMVLVLFLIKK